MITYTYMLRFPTIFSQTRRSGALLGAEIAKFGFLTIGPEGADIGPYARRGSILRSQPVTLVEVDAVATQTTNDLIS